MNNTLEQNNPFAPPETAVADSSAQKRSKLASRWRRLGGGVIDSLFGLGVLAVVMKVGGWSFVDLMSRSWSLTLSTILITWAVQIGLLLTRNQSLGKLVIGTRITRPNGSWVSAGRVVGLRVVLLGVLYLIPVVGGIFALIDVLFIFGSQRRCLHDYMADTIVIRI